ncbi:MAG TPA: response regulator transcription factor [Actinomycetales bacterium]|nr:response regulator transcription factor [Actinomycetales bacterium]
MTVRVVLADDHPMFRFGLRAVLEQADGIEVVGEAADGRALLALVAREAPDVVLTDLSMEGVDGVGVIETLARQSGGPPVIALTMHGDDAHVRAALRAGARGYLLKGATGSAIAAAVRSAASGQDAFDPSVTRRMVAVYAGARAAFPDLTPREHDVLELIAQGCANREIARRLALADKTVRNVTSSLLVKLAVPDRTAAAIQARDAGYGRVRPDE